MIERPKSEALWREVQERRAAGASLSSRREAYEAWFTQRCKEGRPPDALLLYSADEAERFWSRTVAGPDGHVFWVGAKFFVLNDGRQSPPQRWAYRKQHGELSHYATVETTCGEENCVNPQHLRVRPRESRRANFPDERALGALQVLAMRLGHTPTRAEWDAAGMKVTGSAMIRRFGSWGSFCSAAGLRVSDRPRRLTRETCVAAVNALAARLGRRPTTDDWRDNHDWLRSNGYPTSPTSLRNKIGGSFTEAVSEALLEGRRAA